MFILNFRISDNADHSFRFSWVDNNGQPVSLAGSTLLMHVRKKPGDRVPALEMSSDNDLAVIDEDEPNQFTLKFPVEGLRPGEYVFDLLRLAAGERLPMAEGSVIVSQGVTR